MAKDLQPIERQVQTPNASIKPNQAYAAIGEATSQLGNLLTNVLEKGTEYYGGLAGEEAALKGKAPKNLMPPLNKATSAYNQAVINTETRQLENVGREMILKSFAQHSDPAKFNKDTPALFAAEITGITQGVLDVARPETKGALTAQLNQMAATAKIKMLDESIRYDNIQTAAAFNRDLAFAEAQRKEAVYLKDEALIAAAKQNISDLLKDYSAINQQILDQLPDITKKLNDQLKTDEVVSDYLQAYRNGDEIKFLDNLTKQKPANLTQAEYFNAMQEVLKIEKTFAATEAKYNNEQYAKAHYEIAAHQITSLKQLEEQYGNKIPASYFYTLSESLLKQKSEEDAVFVVETTRRYGANEVDKLPAKTLNNYYKEKERQILDEINSKLPDNEVPINRLNLAQRAEFIVLPAGAPIPEFLTDLSYGLKSTDPVTAMDALNAYRVLYQNQGAFGDTLKGLDSDADDIAQYAMTVGDVSEAATLDLIKTAQNNINDKSEPTMTARRERLKQLYAVKDGVNMIQSSYKQTYGSLPNNANADAHYGTFQKLFDNYFMGVADGSQTIALSLSQNALRDWGKSKYGEPEAMMYAPPELAIPFAKLGYWMDNQVGEALNGLLTRNEQAETGLARPKWMADLPINDQTTEQQFMDTNFYPKRTALVNGIEREIYIQSSKNTRTSEYPGEIYQFYYKDDYGVKQYLSDPADPLAAVSWVAVEMYDFVPSVYQKMSKESFDEMAYEIYAKENIGKTDKAGLVERNQYVPFFIDSEDVETGRRLLAKSGKLDDAELEAIKERLRKAGSKKIVFKNGKPVEASDVEPPPPGSTIGMKPEFKEGVILGAELPEDIGRRK